MKRKIEITLLAMLVFVIGGLIGNQVYTSGAFRAELNPFAAARLKEAESVTYVLNDSDWMMFRFEETNARLKLVTNASLPLDIALSARDDELFEYAIEYRLLSSGRESPHSGRYYFRTRILRTLPKRLDRELTVSRYEPGVPLIPAASQLARFNLSSWPNIDGVAIRLLDHDPRIEDVAIRAYIQETLPEFRVKSAWQRLSPGQKKTVAKHVLYGPENLTELERRNLVQRRWRPLGPQGGLGDDYQQRRLYTLRDQGQNIIRDPILPSGEIGSIRRYVTITVPDLPGELVISMTRIETENADVPAKATLNWYGEGPWARQSYTADLAPDRTLWRQDSPPGLVVVDSEIPVAVRAFIDNNGALTDITPPTGHLQVFRVDEADALSYRIEHLGDMPTPLRVDLRIAGDMFEEPLPPVPRRVFWEFRDEDGVSLSRGEKSLFGELSVFDHPAGHSMEAWMSEPTRLYFEVPVGARRLLLTSDRRVWASAYSRPPDMPATYVIPDSYVPWLNPEDTIPQWQVLQPEALRQWLKFKPDRLMLIHWQRRSPEDDPDIIEGRYDWEAFTPDSSWKGRFLLVPRDSQQPVRPEALSAVYRELAPNRTQRVNIPADIGIAKVRPKLLFIRRSYQRERVRILSGEQVLFDQLLAGREGEIALPDIDPGRRDLTIESASAARWFINRAEGSSARWLRAFAVRVTPGQNIGFTVNKKSIDELPLSARLFVPQKYSQVSVNTRIRGFDRALLQAYDEWTTTDRRYEIDLRRQETAWVLNSERDEIGSGERMYLNLGTDFPPGPYRVEFNIEGASEAFLLLYRVEGGIRSTRKIMRGI